MLIHKISAQKEAQLFYGLKYESDIETIENAKEKDKYELANKLVDYIFNKII